MLEFESELAKGDKIKCQVSVQNGYIIVHGSTKYYGFNKKMPFSEFMTQPEVINELKKMGCVNVKKQSIASEKKVAKELGLKREPQSGAQSGFDHSDEQFIYEQKDGEKQITIKKTWLQKLRKLAIGKLKEIALILNFGGDRYFLISEYMFQKVREK